MEETNNLNIDRCPKRLNLLRCDTEVIHSVLEGKSAIQNKLGLSVSDQWSEYGVSALKYVKEKLEKGEPAKWWSYLIIDCTNESTLIGLCGFKGAPDEEGCVEIGYEVAKSFRLKGVATWTAGELVRMAFDDRKVESVLAHTMPVENASNAVLRKNGFQFEKEITIDGDGRVWRWRLTRRH